MGSLTNLNTFLVEGLSEGLCVIDLLEEVGWEGAQLIYLSFRNNFVHNSVRGKY